VILPETRPGSAPTPRKGPSLSTSDRIIYGFPGPAAKVIATVFGQPKQAAIFAYTTGAMMVGLAAPAKRVGFFIHRDTDYSPTTSSCSTPLSIICSPRDRRRARH